MELSKDRVLPITGKVQHYAWGGFYYLPKLLNIPVKKGETYAEFWLGTHDRGSAEFRNGSEKPVSLKEYVEAFPDQTLGEKASRTFGRLPFLLKVLDVKDMLSIQVHPSREDAQIAFDAENVQGIDLASPERNFKDNNHKPELMLALSDFWLLHGFKVAKNLQKILREIPELHFLVPIFGGDNYKKLYRHVMEMPQVQIDRHLKTLLDRIVPHYQAGKLSKEKEDFWAARAAITYSQNGHVDRGIFSIYFFNLLHLQSGQAVYQDAGLPHAYLEGQNVEIMSNSDNVLRGGLTPKHVNVSELLKHVKFEPTIPNIITGTQMAAERLVYRTPAPDFELSRLQIGKGESVKLISHSIEIFLVFTGSAQIEESKTAAFKRNKGEAWVSFDAANSVLTALEDTIIYQASIPGMN
ncbi:MAG: mannose-6-phosphate isomerase, class I [Bacteroidota bacterium]|nr:mannose-6-phosphate isomerase, class I [Bacteroidota bacterium]